MTVMVRCYNSQNWRSVLVILFVDIDPIYNYLFILDVPIVEIIDIQI